MEIQILAWERQKWELVKQEANIPPLDTGSTTGIQILKKKKNPQ